MKLRSQGELQTHSCITEETHRVTASIFQLPEDPIDGSCSLRTASPVQLRIRLSDTAAEARLLRKGF